MLFDLETADPGMGYRLLAATVTPRPIAWVTSLGPGGVLNLAPYSFFNAVGGAPPVVALGLTRGPEGGLKDTARNIAAQGEFVVNLVAERMAAAMNLTSAPMPPGVSEADAAGLATEASARIRVPRLKAAPVALECRVQHMLETGPDQRLVVGEVMAVHVADRYVTDARRGHVDTAAMGLVARMHGSGWYARTTDLFELARPE